MSEEKFQNHTSPRVQNFGDETHAPLVVTPADLISLTLSLDTNAYTSGDVLAATQVLTDALRVEGGRAVLQSLVVIDKDDQGVEMDVLLFATNQSLGTENQAPDIDDTEVEAFLGLVNVASSDYKDLGGCKVATVKGIGLVVEADAASKDLYVAVITRGAPTHTAAGVQLKFGFLQ